MVERRRIDPEVECVFWQLVLGLVLIVDKSLLNLEKKSRRNRSNVLTWEEVWVLANNLFNQGRFLGSEILLADATEISECPEREIETRIGIQLKIYRNLLIRLGVVEESK